MAFQHDLKNGQKLEHLVGDILETVGCKVEYNNDARFDLKVTGKTTTLIECKNEMKYCYRNRNICIEFKNIYSNCHSGILSTKAELEIHYFSDDEIIVFRTAPMKEFVNIVKKCVGDSQDLPDGWEYKELGNKFGHKNSAMFVFDRLKYSDRDWYKVTNLSGLLQTMSELKEN